MLGKPYVAVFLLGLTLLHLPAAPAQELLYWRVGRPLTWNDFKGQPTTNNWRHAASIHFHMCADVLEGKNRQATIAIRSFCYPHKNWKRPNELSYPLLKHEQIHFDITELYARKARKKIAECKCWYRSNGHFRYGKLGRIYHRYWWACCIAEMCYDIQTRHSLRSMQQDRWNSKVARKLAAYRQYAQN
ncbi:MAG: hypothetical protein JSS82_12220 [Bacteroidetes bacterium]|nr:hypothetical protein [Bacteroidota bacterium]